MSESSTPNFADDIKTLFRESDRQAMLASFDLWSYEDVTSNATRILGAVSGGSMPCDEPWPSEKVDLLKRWIDGGAPE
jgi:hypothetical protein